MRTLWIADHPLTQCMKCCRVLCIGIKSRKYTIFHAQIELLQINSGTETKLNKHSKLRSPQENVSHNTLYIDVSGTGMALARDITCMGLSPT